MSGIISAKPFNAYFPETYNATWQGFVTAIYEIGCLLGAVAMLLFGDMIGRRKAIVIGAAIMIFGTIIQVTPMKGHHATVQFIMGRTITGVGNGMNTATIPTYQAECSKTANRGLLICIEGGVIAFGTYVRGKVDVVKRTNSNQADRVLDRLRLLVRARPAHMAIPHCVPDLLRARHPLRTNLAPRVAALALDEGPPRGSCEGYRCAPRTQHRG
jgi:hypothetical protein